MATVERPCSTPVLASDSTTCRAGARKWRRAADVMMTEIDHEVALMSIELGKYIFLNQTASAVWRLLGDPNSIDGVVGAMLATFEVDEETCRSEVSGLFQQLEAQSLIEHAGAPGRNGAAAGAD